jgi:SAM-dependent methyltransferase
MHPNQIQRISSQARHAFILHVQACRRRSPENVFRIEPVVLKANRLFSMHTNYRESHVGKGREYHDKFVRGPYRSLIWELEQTHLLEILTRFRTRQPTSIELLDFACGTGRILEFLESHVDSAVGIDISQSMLEVARGHVSKAELLHADLTHEPVLANRRFELITAFRFFPNAEPALRNDVMRELVGLLANDGILILNNHLRCAGTKMRLRRAIRRLAGKGTDRDLHCMSDAEVEALADRFGLSILEVHTLAVVPILKEKRPLIPRWLLSSIERWASDRAFVARLANTRIYVLASAGSFRAVRDDHREVR